MLWVLTYTKIKLLTKEVHLLSWIIDFSSKNYYNKQILLRNVHDLIFFLKFKFWSIFIKK